MSKIIDRYISRSLRRTISSKKYNDGRLKSIHRNISYWADSMAYAHTFKERNYCNYMLNMYLKRYFYYINRKRNK